MLYLFDIDYKWKKNTYSVVAFPFFLSHMLLFREILIKELLKFINLQLEDNNPFLFNGFKNWLYTGFVIMKYKNKLLVKYMIKIKTDMLVNLILL